MSDIVDIGLSVDSRQVTRGTRALDKFGKEALTAGGSTARLNRTLSGGKVLFVSFAAAAAATTIVMLKAVGASNQMNAAMANVASLLPGQTARVTQFKTAIQQLSIELGTPTSGLAGGAYEVVSAFGDANDTMDKLRISAIAATAGMTDTQSAVKLLAAVTKGYGDTTAAALSHVSDLAFETVRLGQTTFPELAGSMGRVISVAAQMQVSQEELFAGYATLTGVTGDTARVTTQLFSLMNALIKPTTGMSAAITKLGFADAETLIKTKGFVGSLQALVGTTDGTSVQMGKLFENIEALPGLLALTGAQAEVFKQKLDEIKDSSGATQSALAEQQGNFNEYNQAIKEARATLGVFLEKLGDIITQNPKVVAAIRATIDEFKRLAKLIGIDLRSNLDMLGDMRIELLTVQNALKQNTKVLFAEIDKGAAGSEALKLRFADAITNLMQKERELTASIGEQEQAYISAHSAIKKNTAAVKGNAGAKKKDNAENLQTIAQLKAISSILDSMTRKLLVNKGVKEKILEIDVLNFQKRGATAEQSIQFIALDKKIIAAQQMRIEMGKKLGAMMTGKVLIQARQDLLKVKEKLAEATLSQADADQHRQETAQASLALDVLAFEQGNGSAEQLVELIGIKREQIAVEEEIIAQKREQVELFAQAQALNDLRNLQDNSPLAQSPDSELARLQEMQDKKLAMIADHNTLVIQAQVNAGFSLDTIQATFAQQERDRDKQTAAFKLQTAAGAFGAAANFMQNLTVIAGEEGGAMFETMKGLASAQALIDTYAAAQGAYRSLVGIPIVGPALAVAAAAAATVAGLARVAQIQRTQPGATSGSSIGGGGVTNPGFTGGGNNAGPPPIPVTQANNQAPIGITVNVYNPMSDADFDKLAEEQLGPALERMTGRNIRFG